MSLTDTRLSPITTLLPIMAVVSIAFLIIGVILVHPNLNMPALTPFTHGGGPVIPGKLYPFVFITIACGAISGFHALISSGTTPKMIAKETDARMIGYGAMLMEGVVGVVALIAATPPERPLTSAGVRRRVLVPSPSWPSRLAPQHHNEPSLVSAQL